MAASHNEAEAFTLIRSKLQRPRLPGDLIPWRRLLDRLHASSDRKLTLMSAMAGTGKTKLLALAELILYAPAQDAIDALADRGTDTRFIAEIARSMEGESSALFVLAREDSMHDAGETRSVLALFRGRIHQTSLSPEIEVHLSVRWPLCPGPAWKGGGDQRRSRRDNDRIKQKNHKSFKR